eukprot:262389-Chlamydomonas_euryale.AAC.2
MPSYRPLCAPSMTRRWRRSETCRQTTRCYTYRTGGCSWWDLSFSCTGFLFSFPSLACQLSLSTASHLCLPLCGQRLVVLDAAAF